MKKFLVLKIALLFLTLSLLGRSLASQELTHNYADSDGVKIHYVSAGSGPLVVMIHGFPDYWYTWRDQIRVLAKTHRVVAVDQRGYNKSDQPVGVANYTMKKLAADIAAVIDDCDADVASVVGHDWGGAVAWSVAMYYPKKVENLIILNLPHPNGMRRELENNPTQFKNSQYARSFQKPGAAKLLTSKGLAAWVKEPDARLKYVQAFERSSFEGMLNYYKANFPVTTPKSKEDKEPSVAQASKLPKIKCPVLIFHGLDDPYLLAAGLNNTWDWLEDELTLITIPGASHFVHRDASEKVSNRMALWLNR